MRGRRADAKHIITRAIRSMEWGASTTLTLAGHGVAVCDVTACRRTAPTRTAHACKWPQQSVTTVGGHVRRAPMAGMRPLGLILRNQSCMPQQLLLCVCTRPACAAQQIARTPSNIVQTWWRCTAQEFVCCLALRASSGAGAHLLLLVVGHADGLHFVRVVHLLERDACLPAIRSACRTHQCPRLANTATCRSYRHTADVCGDTSRTGMLT